MYLLHLVFNLMGGTMARLSYYSDTLTSVAGADLIAQIEAATGKEAIVVKQLTMIASSAFTFKINGETWVNSVYEDSDTKHKVSLTDIGLTAIIVVENAIDIFIAILF